MLTTRTRAVLMAGATTLSLSAAAYASEFSRVIVFGDRYLDAGQFVDDRTVFAEPDEEITTDGRGRFTDGIIGEDIGHTWSTLVSRQLGHGDTHPNQPQVLPNSPPVTRGLNYAAGFYDTSQILASINGTTNLSGITYRDGNDERSVAGTQDTGILLDDERRGRVANSVVLMNGGAQDIRNLAQISLNFDGSVDLPRSGLAEDQTEINSAARTGANRIAQGAVLLRDAGAGLVVVSNLFDMGRIPEVARESEGAVVALAQLDTFYANQRATFPEFNFDTEEALDRAPYERMLATPEIIGETRTSGTNAFNARLAANLDGQNNIVVIDQHALFDEMLANPVRFGLSATLDHGVDCRFDSVLHPCNEVDSSISGHLFTNGVDLSTTAHAMFGQHVAAVINAPVQVSGLPFTAMASGREVANAGRAQVSRERIARKGWAPFVSGGIGSSSWSDLSGEGDHGSQRVTGVAGITYNMGNGFSVGAAGGYQNTSRAMSGTTIEIEGSGVYGTVFAGADIGNFFGNATVTVGSLDYDEVTRQTKIGAATFENTGETDASVFGASVEVGFRAITTDVIAMGPIASLDHWSADVDSYDEDGWSATAVNYTSDLDASSTRASLGLFLEGGDLNNESMPAVFRVKALYTRELDRDKLDVTARTQTMPNNSFTREGRGAQADSMTIGAQLVYDFGPVIGSLNYDVRIGEADDHSGSIDFSVPFGGK